MFDMKNWKINVLGRETNSNQVELCASTNALICLECIG